MVMHTILYWFFEKKKIKSYKLIFTIFNTLVKGLAWTKLYNSGRCASHRGGTGGIYVYLRSCGQVAAATCCVVLDDLQRRPTGGHDRKRSADRESNAPLWLEPRCVALRRDAPPCSCTARIRSRKCDTYNRRKRRAEEQIRRTWGSSRAHG